jgi:GPH family glycoside/pentoside/hexuronide:cation symporter
MTSGEGKIGFATRLKFGSGAAAYGVVDNGFNYFLLFYYSQVLGAPATLVGGAILCALLVDAFIDPVIGQASDRLRSRWGRRHPFMYASAIPVALSFFLIWRPPEADGFGLALYLALVATTLRVSLAAYEIPSSALVADMSRDYDERTDLLSYRFLFQWSGGLAVGILMYWVLLKAGPDDPTGYFNIAGYQTYGIAGSIVILTAILISAHGTHPLIPTLSVALPSARPSLGQSVRELFETLAERSFLAIFGSTVILGLGAALAAALAVYFNTFLWELDPGEVGIIFLSGLVSAPVASVVARATSRRFDKKRAAIGLAALAFVIAPLPIILRLTGAFPANDDPVFFPLFLGITVFDLALVIAAQILIASMVADVPDQAELRTGRRSEGLFFAAQMFARKSVSGLGVLLAGLVLDLSDFPSGGTPPTSERLSALGWLYVPIMLCVYAAGLVALSFYEIGRQDHTRAKGLRNGDH